MSKHTKGPWRAIESEVGNGTWGIVGVTGDPAEDEEEEEETIATVWDRTCEEPEANARLIAAAPAFLSACQGANEDGAPLDTLEWLIHYAAEHDALRRTEPTRRLDAAQILLADLREALDAARGDPGAAGAGGR